MKAHQRIMREREQEAAIEELPIVYLKNSHIKRISITEAVPYILKYEWLGKMPGWSEYAFAHMFDGKIGGIVILGHTTGSNIAFKKMFSNLNIIQLQRGVNLWWTPKNSASFFISKVCNWLKHNTEYDIITATADEEAGEIGTIYQSLNWKYIGAPKHGHPKFIIDGKDIHPKTLYDRHGTSSVKKIQEIYGDRVETKPRKFKHRYVYPIRKGIRIKGLSYPKRNNLQ